MLAAPAPKNATSAAPVAATEATTAAAKPKLVPFGKGRGPEAIPVPVVGGVDAKIVFDTLFAALTSAGIASLEDVVTAFDATPKNLFPGNKHGRAAYALGGVLKNILKIHTSLNTEKAASGERKARVKQSDKFAAILKQIQGVMGGADALKNLIGADALKALGLKLD